MERFAAIIPDRNDRPEFTQFCFQQIERMTLKPDEIIHVNYAPISDDMDLAERIHYGVMAAQSKGIDLVFILENDDSYPADYFERYGDFNADIFGDDLTFYYNLKNRTFKPIPHSGRSSLFTTGFRISKIKNFQFKESHFFLDVRLWRWANDRGLKRRFIYSGATGIKHGVGKCGGKGHIMKFKNEDHDMAWLKGRVDREAYLFYSEMSRKLWEKQFA